MTKKVATHKEKNMIHNARLKGKNHTLFTKVAKIDALSDQNALGTDHTLCGRTYLYSPYTGVIQAKSRFLRL